MNEEPPNSGSRAGGVFGWRFSARPEGSPYPKAELLPRLLARLTDFTFAAILPVTFGLAGVILAALFLLFADGMFDGQSPGKRLLGIKVVHLPSRQGADCRASALRNFPFALAFSLNLAPSIAGLLLLASGAALLAFESWLVFSDKLGVRLGDLLAETQVVDTKVAVGAEQVRPALRIVRSGGTHAREAARVLFEPTRRGPSVC